MAKKAKKTADAAFDAGGYVSKNVYTGTMRPLTGQKAMAHRNRAIRARGRVVELIERRAFA
jgi:hypothetical protein